MGAGGGAAPSPPVPLLLFVVGGHGGWAVGARGFAKLSVISARGP